MALTLRQRFYCRVIQYENSCHIWDGYCLPSGYGLFNKRLVHRIAYELEVGPIPEGLFVLHRCNVHCCVKPLHLYVGDHEDNMRDLKYKNRRLKELEDAKLKNFNQLVQDLK